MCYRVRLSRFFTLLETQQPQSWSTTGEIAYPFAFKCGQTDRWTDSQFLYLQQALFQFDMYWGTQSPPNVCTPISGDQDRGCRADKENTEESFEYHTLTFSSFPFFYLFTSFFFPKKRGLYLFRVLFKVLQKKRTVVIVL